MRPASCARLRRVFIIHFALDVLRGDVRMHEIRRLRRSDVRKAFSFPIHCQKLLRGYASIRLIALIATVIFVSASARAQRPRPQTVSIPSPRLILGFNPGDDRTIADWKQIGDYFTRLDAASDRVQLQTIGKSTLGRTMFVAFISAPENIRNLEKYKDIQRRLADPRLNPADGRVDFSGLLIRE